ncbi:hypothetical protein SEA_LIBERTYBELL_67 [Streptomyces phage LibertyBell]|nr:hypothetical protein SEA_LIBERTYBELL_67 [Streptomyces phage LibertyBell]
MEIGFYRRKSFEVQAVKVSPENLYDVARWVGSHVQQDWDLHDGRMFVEIRSGFGGRQKTAVFVGDWVTLRNGTFNRASDKTFVETFESNNLDRYKKFEEILKLVETRDAGVPAGDIAQQILNLP